MNSRVQMPGVRGAFGGGVRVGVGVAAAVRAGPGVGVGRGVGVAVFAGVSIEVAVGTGVVVVEVVVSSGVAAQIDVGVGVLVGLGVGAGVDVGVGEGEGVGVGVATSVGVGVGAIVDSGGVQAASSNRVIPQIDNPRMRASKALRRVYRFCPWVKQQLARPAQELPQPRNQVRPREVPVLAAIRATVYKKGLTRELAAKLSPCPHDVAD